MLNTFYGYEIPTKKIKNANIFMCEMKTLPVGSYILILSDYLNQFAMPVVKW